MSKTRTKLALVTGGCRRLGAQISAQLASAGYVLALHGHNDAEPEPELAAIFEQHATRWHGFVADFDIDGSVEELLGDVTDHFGKAPDLIVNNASLFEYDDQSSINQQTLERHLRINLVVPALLTTSLSALQGDGTRAAIVNIVDQRVRNPNGDQLSYTLSKQALAESVRTLAKACAPKLRVNAVAPGLTLPTEDYTDNQMERLAEAMPLNQLSSPEDIAEAVLFLAEAGSMTGQTVFVDGGAHLECFDRDFVFLGKG
ncbi:SDR family oxidoreductase [Parasphingorhabdus sp.]|uniref:SDR family oxidoreductase n=1 Tax=Parasphingorhabdus sp. TaxID=2709688 RepID=UPI0032674EF6